MNKGEDDNYKVPYKIVKENTIFREILGWILPLVFFVGIWIFIMRRMSERKQVEVDKSSI